MININDQTINILVVEDNESIRLGIKDWLESNVLSIKDEQFQAIVSTATDGVEGLEQMAPLPPDLIICDIKMPRMNGYEFLSHIRKDPRWLSIPFIFLTAKNTEEDQDRGKLEGANIFIPKPFEPKKLLELVNSQLNRSAAVKQQKKQYLDSFKSHTLQILNHEFRTPLTFILAFYELLESGVETSGTHYQNEYEKYLRGIQAGCVRLSKVIENFMMMLQIFSGETSEEHAAKAATIMNFNELIDQAVTTCRLGNDMSKAVISVNSPDSLPPIQGVPAHVVTILANVIENGIKFARRDTLDKTEVSILVDVEPDWLLVSVCDNGQGVPDEAKPFIFDLFYQHNRALNEQQGMGVGLTIARELIQLHGGRIDLQKREDSPGSCFVLRFPLLDLALETQTAVLAKKTATVLVVEDDLDLRAGLLDQLEKMPRNYSLTLLVAANGKQGLDILKQQVPDLIISDIMMPHMSGYEFLQEVRKNPAWLHIPVIFLTAKGKPPDKHKAFILGVDDYLTKPYESRKLIQFVEAQLDRKAQMQGQLNQEFDSLKHSILTLVTPNFRQPLFFVNEYVDKLESQLDQLEKTNDIQHSLNGIQKGSIWLKRLVDDLIYLAELQTGEAKELFTHMSQRIPSVAVLLAEYTQIHAAPLLEENIQLHCQTISTDSGGLVGNIAQLSESMTRLIRVGTNHSISAHPPHDVTLFVEHNDSTITIVIHFDSTLPTEVADTIQTVLTSSEAEATLRHTFEFGTDISIVQGYIQIHRGQLKLENGENSFAFHITLPIPTQNDRHPSQE